MLSLFSILTTQRNYFFASAQYSYYTGRSVNRSFVVSEYAFSREECERNVFFMDDFDRNNDNNNSSSSSIDDDDDETNRTISSSSFGTLGRFWPPKESVDEKDDSLYHKRWCSEGTSGVTFSSKTKEYVSSFSFSSFFSSTRTKSNSTMDVIFDAKSRASEAKAFSVEFWITPRLQKLDGFTGRYFTPFFTLETPKKNETFNPYAWTSAFDCTDEFDFALYIGTDFSVGFRSREPIAIYPTLVAETCASVITKPSAFVANAVNHFVLTASFSDDDEENALGKNRISCYANGTKIVDEVIGDVLVDDNGKRKFPFANAWRETSAPYFGSTSANNAYDSSDDTWEWTNTVHAFAMYDKKISDEEITLNFHAGLPNAAPLAVDVNVTINEDVKEAKIVLQYADDDYYNATITSTSGSALNHTISSVKHAFSILTLPKIGVLKAIPIGDANNDDTNYTNGDDADSSMQTADEAAAIPVTRVPFKCFGNAVFYTPEPNDHSWIHDSNELTTLELYASFSFKATETSLMNEFETVDSLNQGLVSIFISPVNDAPSGVFHVVEYFGREEGKSFQIEFRDDDEYISKIEVSRMPTIGKVRLSSASSSPENTKTLNLGDIIDVTSEAESLTYRLDDVVNFVPSIIEEKKEYLSDFFSYYVYDKYDEKAVNETKVEFRVQSPVRRMPPSSFSSVKETKENVPLEFTIDVLRLDCKDNATEAIVETLPTNGTVYLIRTPAISTSSVVAEEDKRKTPLKENDVVRLEHTYMITTTEDAEGQDGIERCVAFANLLFVPDDFYFNAPNVDIFGDAVSTTTRYASLRPRLLLSFSARDILDGWIVPSVLNVSFTVMADVPHAPAKFRNISMDASASALPPSPSPSYLLRVDSNETHINDSSSTFLLPTGGYLKFYKAFEYDLYPDYDSVFGVAVTIKSINPSNAAFLANVSVAFPSEHEDAVKLNTSSIVVTKWLRNQIRIAGPPSAVRDIFFHYVLYDAKTMKKTPRVVRDTLELTLEYGFVKLYNAKKMNETINAKYDWKHDSCRIQQQETTPSNATKPCTSIAHVNIEAIAYPSSYDSLTQETSAKDSNAVSQKSLFISGLFQGAVAGIVLLGLWKYLFKKLLSATKWLFCCLFCCRLRPPPSASERRRSRRSRRPTNRKEADSDSDSDSDSNPV